MAILRGKEWFCRGALLGLLFIQVALSQRAGGEIRVRHDDQNNAYFEVFADHLNGNHAAPAPMSAANGYQWPKKVTIGAEGSWVIYPGAAGKVDANGKQGGSCAKPPMGLETCIASGLPWGALIGRWVALDTTRPPSLLSSSLRTTPLTDWFFIGKQAVLDVPIPEKAAPRPFSPPWLALYPGLTASAEFQYTPLVAIQYICNDYGNGFADNDGWLHVYQQWR